MLFLLNLNVSAKIKKIITIYIVILNKLEGRHFNDFFIQMFSDSTYNFYQFYDFEVNEKKSLKHHHFQKNNI